MRGAFALTRAAIFAMLAFALPAGAGQVRVDVRDGGFMPGGVTLNLGDQVVWVWTGGQLHTVTSGDSGTTAGNGIFHSGSRYIPATFAWKSDRIGTIPYYCSIHFYNGETGSLNVVSSGASVADFRITEVLYNDPKGQDLIEVSNLGGATGNLARFRLSSDGVNIAPFPSDENDLPVEPGGRVTLHANATGTDTPTDIYLSGLAELPVPGAVALYLSNSARPGLNETAMLVDYVEWGANAQPLETTAAAAGLWPTGQFAPAVADGHSIEFCGSAAQHGALSWLDNPSPHLGGGGDNCATATRHPTWGGIKAIYR